MARHELTINGLKWVNVKRPDVHDLTYIKSVFRFHPIVIDAIASPTLHPLLERYDDHFFLIMHFPVIYPGRRANDVAEVDFLVTPKLIVTITYREFAGLEKVFSEHAKHEVREKHRGQKHTGHLLYGIIDALFSKLILDLDYLDIVLTRVEKKIYSARHGKIIEDIAHARRDILDFRRVVVPQQLVLRMIPEVGEKFYGKAMTPYLTDLVATGDKIRNFVENHKETLDALYQTHESLVSSNISRIVAVLTVFSAIVLPLNLLASIWGMNHERMPLRDGPYDFWIVMLVMASVATGLIVMFRRWRWL